MNIKIEIIPHGHGLSFKKGCSDGLLNNNFFEENLPNGHYLSYQKGVDFGKKLQKNISLKIKDL